MANPATTTDLEVRWRPLGPDEEKAQALLDDAWEIVLRRVPDIEAGMLEDSPTEGLVTAIVCQMVLRVLKNPDSLSEEQIDDYRYKTQGELAPGVLDLTEAELALLTDDTGSGIGDNAFTIGPWVPEEKTFVASPVALMEPFVSMDVL